MILKVQTKDNGWRFHGDVRDVKVRSLSKNQYNHGIDEGVPNYMEIDKDALTQQFEKFNDDNLELTTDVKYICKVIAFSAHNKYEILYTNLAAYLISGCGKTIERIN